MNDQNVKRHLAAIVVADLVGYSQLVGADETGAVAAVRERWEKVLKPLVVENGGSVVKFMGDGALVEFPSAVMPFAQHSPCNSGCPTSTANSRMRHPFGCELA
jgi:class 3 adenylate cyclase